MSLKSGCQSEGTSLTIQYGYISIVLKEGIALLIPSPPYSTTDQLHELILYSFIEKIYEFSLWSIFDFVEEELRNLEYIELKFKTIFNERSDIILFFLSFHVLCYGNQCIDI